MQFLKNKLFDILTVSINGIETLVLRYEANLFEINQLQTGLENKDNGNNIEVRQR